jgi:hypothetical protein
VFLEKERRLVDVFRLPPSGEDASRAMRGWRGVLVLWAMESLAIHESRLEGPRRIVSVIVPIACEGSASADIAVCEHPLR